MAGGRHKKHDRTRGRIHDHCVHRAQRCVLHGWPTSSTPINWRDDDPSSAIGASTLGSARRSCWALSPEMALAEPKKGRATDLERPPTPIW